MRVTVTVPLKAVMTVEIDVPDAKINHFDPKHRAMMAQAYAKNFVKGSIDAGQPMPNAVTVALPFGGSEYDITADCPDEPEEKIPAAPPPKVPFEFDAAAAVVNPDAPGCGA